MIELTTQDKARLQVAKDHCHNVMRFLPFPLVEPQGSSASKRIVIAGGFVIEAFCGMPWSAKDVDVFILGCESDFRLPKEWTAKNSGVGTLASYPPVAPHPNVSRPKEITDSIISRFTYNVTIGSGTRTAAIPFNLISTTYKTRHELIDHFDMAQCQIHYAFEDEHWKIFCTPTTLNLIKNRQIAMAKNYSGALQPWRVERYTSRGWTHAVSGV